MSYQYDQYLAKHKENVRNGFEWLQTNLPELVKNIPNLGWANRLCTRPVKV